MIVELSEEADEDLVAIFLQGLEQFGLDQANRYHDELEASFELLARFPGIGTERSEIQLPVRTHPHRSHVIVYEQTATGILVLRVRHGRENWFSDPL